MLALSMDILAIYGAGKLGREVLQLAKEINSRNPKWQQIVFVDDKCPGNVVNEVEVFDLDAFVSNKEPQNTRLCFIIANGDPIARREMSKNLVARGLGSNLCTLISPKADISEDAQIKAGSLIFAGARVSVSACIGENCLVYFHSLIGHDVTIGNNSVISSTVNLAGDVKVSEEVFIGMGSFVRERVRVGNNSVIGMGSFVHDDVPSYTLQFGNPAKHIREIERVSLYRSYG